MDNTFDSFNSQITPAVKTWQEKRGAVTGITWAFVTLTFLTF